MKLSIVILNYNVRYFLELCLKSVTKAIQNIDAEIIVIDNNSSDDSCAMVASTFPHVKLLRNTQNMGFAKANNSAVKIATGDYICILNPDTVVAEDTFTKILNFAETKENLGIIGCRLIDGTGRFLPESKRNIPTVKIASQKVLGCSKHYYANQISEHSVSEAPIFAGAFMFIKRSVFKEVKGFDEDFFMYGEDIDLSYRMIQRNLKNYYYGKTSIIHYKGESTVKDKTYTKRFYDAMLIFYNKHFKTSKLFNLLIFISIKVAQLIKTNPHNRSKAIYKRVVLSHKLSEDFEMDLPFKVEVVKTLGSIKPCTEIIFDANTISYSEIISMMSSLNTKPKIRFKIIPHNSAFIISSNDSVNQGEIITFKKNSN